jgi:hypothetical protein
MMEVLAKLLEGIWFVPFVAAVMVLTNLVNARGYFVPFYNFLEKRIKSKRLLIALISAVSGILPVPGRVIISAGALDTLAPNDERRKNYGIINYLSTHHYYLWSPLEATVLIPLSVLGISYFYFLSLIAPLLITIIGITLYYIFYVLKEEDIVINKVERKKQNVVKNIKWDVVVLVALVIIVGNGIKMYSDAIVNFFMSFNSSIFFASVIAFVTSFILGSSSKFAGITTLLVTIFGVNYLPLFFSLGYSGYLISPTHKCLVITKSYFNLDMGLYKILLLIGTALVTVGYLLV